MRARQDGMGSLAAAGMLGGLAGSLAMNLFGRTVLAARAGREADGAAPGGDRTGRGVQPPQAAGNAGDDATVRTGRVVYRAVTGEDADWRTERWLGTGMHYAFGALTGLVYGLLARRVPAIRAGNGTVYGTLVWAVADEGVMPALGLSRSPRHLSPGVHAYALAGHIVFGLALDAVTRTLTPPPGSLPGSP